MGYRAICQTIEWGVCDLHKQSDLLNVRLATLVRTDMPLVLFVFLSGVLIWKKIRKKEEREVHDIVE